MRYTGDRRDGPLLGVQLVGHLRSEIEKRIDVPATAIFNEMTIDALSDLDLSYTPERDRPDRLLLLSDLEPGAADCARLQRASNGSAYDTQSIGAAASETAPRVRRGSA